jgi:hypothetical protein
MSTNQQAPLPTVNSWVRCTDSVNGSGVDDLERNPENNNETKAKQRSPSRLTHALDAQASSFGDENREESQPGLIKAPSGNALLIRGGNSLANLVSNNFKNEESQREVSLFAKGVQLPGCSFSFRQMNKKGEVSPFLTLLGNFKRMDFSSFAEICSF